MNLFVGGFHGAAHRLQAFNILILMSALLLLPALVILYFVLISDV